MTEKEALRQLADTIRESDEYKYFQQCKNDAFENETTAALLREYGRLQTKLQMFALTGKQADEEEMTRFQQMSGLLLAMPDASAYLLSQMQMQKKLADLFAFLCSEAGVPVDVPQLS